MPGLPSRMASLLIPSRRNVRKIFAPFAPTLGAELLTDGGLENWNSATDLTSWTEAIAGTSTINREATTIYAGTYAARMDIDGSGSNAQFYQIGGPALGTWELLSAYARCGVTGTLLLRDSSSSFPTVAHTLTTAYALYCVSGRSPGVGQTISVQRSGSAGQSLYIDTVSMKSITLASMFATLNARFSNFNLVAPPISTFVTGTPAGIVLCLDSATAPANFVIAYVDSAGNVKTDKCVAGTYTNLNSTVAAYGATKYFSAKKTGNDISIYYGTTDFGTLITTQTVADAGITSNTRHGLFNTYSGNLFAATPFTVVPYS